MNCKLYFKNIFLFLLSSFTLFSQTYNFQNITTQNGLSQAQVLSVFQDNEGTMWFGTNDGGITKYNGQKFEYLSSKNALGANIVYSIASGIEDEIWIGTTKGISVYKKDKIIKRISIKDGLNTEVVLKLYKTKDEKIVIGTTKGVNIVDKKNDKIITWQLDSVLSGSVVVDILEENDGNVWFSTLGNGAFRYDGKSIKQFNVSEKENYIFSVFQYAENEFWLCTSVGLYKVKNNILVGPIFENLYPNYDVAFYTCAFDKSKNVWITTDKGIFKYSSSGSIKKYTTAEGLVNNDIWKVFCDREGNMWFGSKSDGGISKLKNDAFFAYSGLDSTSKNIQALVELPEMQSLAIGIKGKRLFSVINEKTKKAKNITLDAEVLCFSKNENELLLGTAFGAYKYNFKSEKTSKIELKKFDLKNYIFDICIDDNKVAWLGTKGGVARLVDNEIVAFDHPQAPKGFVNKIFQDSKRNYWFASANGLYQYNTASLKHFRETDGIEQSNAYYVTEDSLHNIWIGTSNGLYKYDYKTFTKITEAEGLSSNIIYSIAVDTDNNIWCGSPNGLDKLVMQNGKLLKIRSFGIEDGFMGGECTPNAIQIASDGRILVGTVNGLMVYEPQNDRENDKEPITRIKNLKLFNQETDWKLYADSLDGKGLPVDLSLPYEKNYLSFQYIGVSLSTPGKVQYKYMLKGLDKDWSAETKEIEKTYVDLPPGKYEFLVMAENGEGVWNKEPAVFKFEIRPPFYQTWWFYSMCGFVIIAGVFSYIKIRIANKKISKQNAVIERQNSSLTKANTDIAQRNKNITDSIKYAKRIQQAILPDDKFIKHYLPDSFIFYKPKDIVSGDFYWVHHTADNKFLIAAVDCTGHGVPGAFVSIVGNNNLMRVVNEFGLSKPGEVLDKLNILVEETLRQSDVTEVKDGMDITLCMIDFDKHEVSYAGANNPMYVVRKKENSALQNNFGEQFVVAASNKQYHLYEVKGDKQPIGIYDSRKPFKTHTFKLQPGDSFYLFSDGYADQFGGPRGKKFLYKPLKELFLSMQGRTMEEQLYVLQTTIEDWQGNLEQIDDMCVVGFRVE